MNNEVKAYDSDGRPVLDCKNKFGTCVSERPERPETWCYYCLAQEDLELRPSLKVVKIN